MSVANFEQVSQSGFARRPSPSIWKSCRKTLLNDLGLGTFADNDFNAITPTTTAEADSFGAFGIDADAATVSSRVTGRFSGVLDLETDGDDNDAWALFTEAMASFNLNSNQRVWYEVDFEVGDIAGDQGWFVGYAEEALLDRDMMADDVAAAGTGDYVGFVSRTGNPDAVDAVYRLQANAEVVVLADVSVATALPLADRVALVNDTPRKYGLTFNGKDRLDYFVDGTRVASVTDIAAATFPNNIDMGAIASLKTGAGAAESAAMGFMRAAFQESY